jgi:hypothetical protein
LAICGYLTYLRLQSDNLRDKSNVNKIVYGAQFGVSSIEKPQSFPKVTNEQQLHVLVDREIPATFGLTLLGTP